MKNGSQIHAAREKTRIGKIAELKKAFVSHKMTNNLVHTSHYGVIYGELLALGVSIWIFCLLLLIMLARLLAIRARERDRSSDLDAFDTEKTLKR